MEYIELGPVPSDEECVQIKPGDTRAAVVECHRYRVQLEKQFGTTSPNGRGKFKVMGFPHGFGKYYEVVVCFSDDVSAEWAYGVEENLPQKWTV